LRFLLRGDVKPSGKIGILAIDEKSIQKFGRWPFPRRVFEKALVNLKKNGSSIFELTHRNYLILNPS
jgi:adenylate cyclase